MQRLSIARAMMHDPEVLFLDEPSSGLDPQTRLLLWEIVRAYNVRGNTIVVTTHNMEEADDLCRRVAIVDHGRSIALGTPSELKATIPGGYCHPPSAVAAETGASRGVRSRLRSPEGRGERSLRDRHLRGPRGAARAGASSSSPCARASQVTDVHVSEPSLENFFLHHTGRSLRD